MGAASPNPVKAQLFRKSRLIVRYRVGVGWEDWDQVRTNTKRQAKASVLHRVCGYS